MVKASIKFPKLISEPLDPPTYTLWSQIYNTIFNSSDSDWKQFEALCKVQAKQFEFICINQFVI